MGPLRAVTVFCGSRPGASAAYLEAARALGAELGRRKIDLVYGGSSLGLMGALADAALTAGAQVIGVLPRGLQVREIAHPSLTRLEITASMHERKARMADLADGFIALPGGFGTFDELFEIVTWKQIGLHAKPIGLLDVDGYFDPLVALAARGVSAGFIPAAHAELSRATDPGALLDVLEAGAVLR